MKDKLSEIGDKMGKEQPGVVGEGFEHPTISIRNTSRLGGESVGLPLEPTTQDSPDTNTVLDGAAMMSHGY